MKVFDNYARYYDLLYSDKDYAGEAEYIHKLIQKHAPNAASILELGCGTAVHARHFTAKGYKLHGVDLSPVMLEQARSSLNEMTSEQTDRLSFSQGDIRRVRLNRTFDVVLSLFHVMSYQATNADLLAAFATVRAHLNKGGIFIFDCWYGPAVLTERPSIRVKRCEDEVISIVRVAEPVMHPAENLVDVHYHVFIRDKATQKVDELKETHRIRYLFGPEVEFFLEENGLRIVESVEWMTEKQPAFDTWSVCFAGRLAD